MRTTILGLVIVPLLGLAPALAECPPGPDTADTRAALHTELLNAPDAGEARRIAGAIWRVWLQAPNPEAQTLLDTGMARREAFDFAGAEEVFDALVALCPDYTEGYNQRAFARFLRQDYQGSLDDIAIVLNRDPYHFGALSGKALNLFRQGRVELAHDTIRQALRVHPYLEERRFLPPEDDI
ncbi:MAG: hypothetical protein AAGE76_02830 [Pseudomonadota bacterium]